MAEKPPPLPSWGNFFYTGSIHFRQFQPTLIFVAEKPPPPPKMRENEGNFGFCTPTTPKLRNFFYWINTFQAISSNFGFCGRKACPHPKIEGKFFLHWIYPFQAILSNFGFCGRKAPTLPRWENYFYTGSIHFRQFWATLAFVAEKPLPSQDEGIFFTLDLSISGNFKQLWLLWQKSLPPLQDEGNFFTLDLSISGNFEQLWFLLQKSLPHCPPPPCGKIFLHWIYPLQTILSNFGTCGRKDPPPPQDEGFFFTLDLSISGNFEQLWFLWQKSPYPSQDEGIFLHWIYPFQAILSNFGFCGRKAPPSQDERIFFTLDLSISGNFEQLWLLLQKSPPPPRWGNFFYTGSIHFRQFWATLVFVAEKPPSPQDEGRFFTGTISIMSNFGKKPPNSPKIFTLNLSISGNFEQLWFLWQKRPSPPPKMRDFFLHWIYPFQAISSNFGFCGRKAPLSLPRWGEFFCTGSIHFRMLSSNFGFCGRKAPPPRMREIFCTGAISGNFEQLFCGRKALPPPWIKMREKAPTLPRFTLDLYISINFEQLWLLWQKSHPQLSKDEGNFFTLDLSISGNFEQLWFLWQKSPSPPPPKMRNFFLHWIYPFQAISSNFGFCGRIAPPSPPRWGKFFYTGSIHFRCFRATLVFVAEKPPPPRMREIFCTGSIHFRQFRSNFGLCGRKALPPPRWGKLLYTGSILFRQFWATLAFVAEKPLPSQDERIIFTLDLSISGNFEQLWLLWQKSPYPPKMREFFLHWIYPF